MVIIVSVFLLVAGVAMAILQQTLQLVPLTSVQFQAHDGHGRVTFGHAGDNQFHTESRAEDGSVQGSYSYIDPHGRLVRVQYEADSEGYRVVEANNLPTVPNTYTYSSVNDMKEEDAAAEFERSYRKELASLESRRKRSILFFRLTPSPSSTSLKVKPLERVTSPADTTAVRYSGVEGAVALTPLAVLPHPYKASVTAHAPLL